MRVTARVPATSANLGPGFDCFGLALDLWNEVEIDTDAEPGVTWQGEGADELPTDGSDMASRAIRAVCADAPPFALRGTNRIPIERGLGSSAAAAVAGLALGARLAGSALTKEMLLDTAVELEGHADNAAAALHGGLVNVYQVDETWRAATAIPSPLVHPVVLIPESVRLRTSRARAALPTSVPFSDAAFNAGRAALAWRALTADPDLLADALADRLHQDVRLELVPEVRAVFERIKGAGIPVCVSGAGPSLLAFEGEDHPVSGPGEGWRILRLAIARTGIEVTGG